MIQKTNLIEKGFKKIITVKSRNLTMNNYILLKHLIVILNNVPSYI